MAIKKTDLMDSICVTKKFVYYKKNKPCKFNVYYRKNKLNLFRLNLYCSCKVKPLDGSPAGLNHPAELY